jgi:hypothetical protein
MRPEVVLRTTILSARCWIWSGVRQDGRSDPLTDSAKPSDYPQKSPPSAHPQQSRNRSAVLPSTHYSGPLERADADVHVKATVSRFNETVALPSVEPLYGSGLHEILRMRQQNANRCPFAANFGTNFCRAKVKQT